MNRIAYIDLIKVLSIFLVILGHSTICGGWTKQWLYAFHMPVFFALYGLSYDRERHEARDFLTWEFVKQKAMRLMLPALIWALLYSILHWSTKGLPSPMRALGLLYLSQASLKSAGSLTSIWFLPCMFLAVLLTELIMQGITHTSHSTRRRNFLLIALSVVLSVITFALPNIPQGYPWCINLVPLACCFILTGFLTRQLINHLDGKRPVRPILWVCILILSFIGICSTFTYNLRFIPIFNADMASAHFGFPLIYLFDAILGLFMMVALSKLTCPKRLHPIVAFMGANTLAIFLIHKPLIIWLSDHLKTAGHRHDLFAIAASLVILLVSSLIAYLINKIYPPIIGNKKSNTI